MTFNVCMNSYDLFLNVLLYSSELGRSLQNASRTRHRRRRDPAPETKVLFLRPKCGFEGSSAVEFTLCAGILFTTIAVFKFYYFAESFS